MQKKVIISVLAILMMVGNLFAVPFTLHNASMFSIPLNIPGVMNPNLSPMSDSGVDLAVGQKVYFFVKRKKYLLLEVTDALKGKKLDVASLILDRRKDLGL